MCKHLYFQQHSATKSQKRTGVYFDTSHISIGLTGKES